MIYVVTQWMVGGLCILEAGPLSPALLVCSAAIEQYQVTTVINFSLNWAWPHFTCTITYTLDRLKQTNLSISENARQFYVTLS